MRKIFVYFIFLLVSIFTCNSAFAENFYIENYNVSMDVYSDKTVDVTEDIDVYFTSSAHGIYRDIKTQPKEDIYEISVFNKKYSVNKQTNNVQIKIGDPNIYVTGNQNYRIKYKHKVSGANNEFYYNIIGTEWNVPIKHVSFTVHMPQEYDSSKAGLSIGSYGTKGFKDIAIFNIDGKTISGKTTNDGLNPREGVTLRVELPDNYFSVHKYMMPYYVLLLMILLTGISFFIWFNYGKDEHVTPVISFYPPQNYNSAQVELIYNGKVSPKGLISLIIWFANKGYIEISPIKDKYFMFTKKGEPENAEPVIKDFLFAFFHNNKQISSDVLERSKTFYVKCQKCIDRYNKQRDQVFEKNSISFKLIMPMFISLIGVILSELYFIFGYSLVNIFPVALFPLVAIIVLITNFRKSPIFFTIWGLGFGGLPMIMITPYISIGRENILFVITGIVCIIITCICIHQLPKRTESANRLYGEILGFKKFLETAELKRVESLVNENPNYCFEVLPYLYVFGLTDKWIKKFEKFFVLSPGWYSGKHFNKNFNKLMNSTARYTMPSRANGGISHSSSRSSSGGGGFSGGGHGGGGGRSW